MEKIIESKNPEMNYQEKAGIGDCAALSGKVILEVLGFPVFDHRDLYNSLMGKRFGIQPEISHWKNEFKKRGLKTESGNLKNKKASDQIFTIQSCINKNMPVMLRIGSGETRQQKYFKIKGLFSPHYIAMLGYNDSGFFVYDSSVSEDFYEKLPIGVIFRTKERILNSLKYSCIFDPYACCYIAARK